MPRLSTNKRRNRSQNKKGDILLVKIQNALNDGKSLYDATRGNWKMNKIYLPHIRFVLGVDSENNSRGYKNRIVSAYVPGSWHIIQEGPDKNRKYFEGDGEIISEILEKAQRCEALLLSKFGSGAAIAYAFIDEIDWEGLLD